MPKKMKFTKMEKAWILYDVGNSAFVLLVATLFPIYFDAIAQQAGISSVDYLAYWGYAASAVTIIVAVTGPVLGAMTDFQGWKKPVFLGSMLLGATGCFLLGFMRVWFVFLILFVIAKCGFSASLIFYDAMLSDVTTPERMDEVSSAGFAWGYIGSCVPFIAGLVFVLTASKTGIGEMNAMTIAFCMCAVWWFCTTIPLWRHYQQVHYIPADRNIVRGSFQRLGDTLKNMHSHPEVFWFLLAFFCYIDGVYTIIDMATAYGTALGLDTTGLLLALLSTQIVAFPATLVFGRLSGRYAPKNLILICIIAYTCITIFGMTLDSQTKFWILAVCVGLFQGGVQALSRSHFAKIIPKDRSGEYFGIFDICGKGASFLGTMLVSVTSQITGSIHYGIGSLVFLFILGILLFRKSCGYLK
uniref:Major facilitator superfamily (MFS) profile domain-containing protein n=1 Tax=Eubacterium plexicaudatum ASF492 TaxID=1235802 RepID=N2A8F8_9FIRM